MRRDLEARQLGVELDAAHRQAAEVVPQEAGARGQHQLRLGHDRGRGEEVVEHHHHVAPQAPLRERRVDRPAHPSARRDHQVPITGVFLQGRAIAPVRVVAMHHT